MTYETNLNACKRARVMKESSHPKIQVMMLLPLRTES
jgi:hypothetical protein